MLSETDPSKFPGLQKWVVGSLSAHKKLNDITFKLCEETGWDWKQAQQFISQVAEMNQKGIHRRRAPLLVGIGAIFLAGGFLLAWWSLLDFSAMLPGLTPPLDAGKIVEYVFMARSGWIMIGKFVVGVAMLVGGGVGIWDALTAAMTGQGKIT